jgi:cob(I)alamin adenosyltransferase
MPTTKSQPTKASVVVVYTGEGKGKTSASLGLTVRALGAGWRVAYIQFIKAWHVSEHQFFADIARAYNGDEGASIDGFTGPKFTFYKGGRGFFHAGQDSAKEKIVDVKTGAVTKREISDAEHLAAARATYDFALKCATSGDCDLVVCDEINNAVHDGLLTTDDLEQLIQTRAPQTSLCLTGRNFPRELLNQVDIATEMHKIKHHYDEGFLAQKGIDF